jgi:hypothetical protein
MFEEKAVGFRETKITHTNAFVTARLSSMTQILLTLNDKFPSIPAEESCHYGFMTQ